MSLLRVGLFSNRLLLAGIGFELAVNAAVVYLPVAHDLLGTRPLDWSELAVLVVFPLIVWVAGEIYRAIGRHRLARCEPRFAPQARAGTSPSRADVSGYG